MSNTTGDPKNVNEKKPANAPTLLDKLEQASRISVPIMIPVVVALLGFIGNNLLNARQNIVEQKKIDLEYVKIAKDVVSNLKPDADPLIASWAYQTLFQLSPVKISQEDIDQLSKNRIPLPSSSSPTLLGGARSSMTDWPWLLSVYKAGQFFCNGTLIAPRMVLSTALCVNSGRLAEYEVVTAINDGRFVRIGRRIPVIKLFIHPEFSSKSWANDIAILELGAETPPPFATISAQQSTDPKVGAFALGAALDFQSEAGSLLQAPIPIVENGICAANFEGKSAGDGTICTGSARGGATLCPQTGSAGGPLVVLNTLGQKYQIGVGSFAADCNEPGAKYGIYTRVSSYAGWIKQVVPNVSIEPIAAVKR